MTGSGPPTTPVGRDHGRGTRRRRTHGAAALLLTIVLAATACSGSKGPDAGPTGTFPSVGTSPPASGAACSDPAGDLATDSKNGGALSEPAGIDLTRAEAVLTSTALEVSFETVGMIDSAPVPTFIVGQGRAGNDVSFEIRAAPVGPPPSPPWALTIATFRGGNEGRAPLQTPVAVKDNTLSFEIPLKDLPPVATLIWQFGSSSGEGDDATFDDCNNFSSPSDPSGSSVPATVRPTSSTTPPTTQAPIPFGQEQIYRTTGSKITVYAAQFPVPNAQPVPPNFSLSPDVSPATIDVQVCAGSNGTEARAAYFQVKTVDNRVYSVPVVPYNAVASNVFPQSMALAANDCIRGYVTFLIGKDSTVSQVFYSPESSARNFLAWKA
jgi:hypothetical protein